jgi:hypothetical protein
MDGVRRKQEGETVKIRSQKEGGGGTREKRTRKGQSEETKGEEKA